MKSWLTLMLAILALDATADEFELGGGILASTAPDCGVTFRANGAKLSFAPFVCTSSGSGAFTMMISNIIL